ARAALCAPGNHDIEAAPGFRDLQAAERFRSTEKKDMKDAHSSGWARSRRARLHRYGLARSIAAALFASGTTVAVADHEGLPFTEPFDDAHLSDASSTTADWGASRPGFLTMPSAEPVTDPFDPSASGE